MIDVIIADDHPVVRNSLARAVDGAMGMQVVSQAANVQQTIDSIHDFPESVVVLDLEMPGGGGMEILRRKKEFGNKLKIIVFSVNSEKIYAIPIIRAGADAYLEKTNSEATVVDVIRMTALGKTIINRELLNNHGDEVLNDQEASLRRLSGKEFLVYQYLISGMRNVDIAHKLGIDQKTVATYKMRIFMKMKVKSVFELLEMRFKQT